MDWPAVARCAARYYSCAAQRSRQSCRTESYDARTFKPDIQIQGTCNTQLMQRQQHKRPLQIINVKRLAGITPALALLSHNVARTVPCTHPGIVLTLLFDRPAVYAQASPSTNCRAASLRVNTSIQLQRELQFCCSKPDRYCSLYCRAGTVTQYPLYRSSINSLWRASCMFWTCCSS